MSSERQASEHSMLPLIFPLLDLDSDYKEQVDPNAAWTFYSHSIGRNPNDLKLHTQRIFCAMKHNNAELLPGSLHDLFFILKDSGENLRIRLLKASAPYLSEKDILYFAMWIKIGTKRGMGYKWIPGAVLSNGLHEPDIDLLEVNQSKENQIVLTPLEEARSCMEYGQLDVAKKILEDALEIDNENEAIQEELAYLSGYTESKQIPPKEVTHKSNFSNAFGKIKEAIFHK